jgi:uncharacterized protein YecE (DUF72 family)
LPTFRVQSRHHSRKRLIVKSFQKRVGGRSSSGDQNRDMRLGATLPSGTSIREREGKSNLQAYAQRYPVVEVNSSFYNFHRTGTYVKWRKETPQDFEFTLKCHQSVSHKERLKPTDKALEGLRSMVERGKACGARILLIQTPASLRAEESVFREASKLFEKAEIERMTLAWETRGKSWIFEEAPPKLAGLLDEHKMVHVTDPLKHDPVFSTDIAYFRLHGLPGYNLKYSYTDCELRQLYKKLKAYEDETETVYIFFNNYAMYRDAQRLLTLHRTGKLPASPFGAKAVAWTIRTFEDWPVTKNELLQECGGWYCWVAPNKSVELRRILQHFKEGVYADTDEVEREAGRIWHETGYPSAKQVEESDQLLR